MKDNFRDPNNQYMKADDVRKMNIPSLAPIEVKLSRGAEDDINRGDNQQTELVYYVGVGKSNDYDTIQYHERLSNGIPVGEEQGIMLPLIDSITVLSRSNPSTSLSP